MKYLFLLTILFSCLTAMVSVDAKSASRKYKEYVIDASPLEKRKDLHKEYMQIYYAEGKDAQTQEEIERAYRIIETVLNEEPRWVDGLWLLSSIAWQWGSSYQEEEELARAREIFLSGQTAAEKCLEIQPDNPLCKLFLGSAIGSIGTIDGVFASIRRAKHVERLWLDVVESEYNYNFYPNVSMQGSVRYGLGIFYRLIPDLRVLSWFFGVRGNIDKSIAMHREGIAIDSNNECNDLMLAAALVCKVKGDRQSDIGKEGFSLLEGVSASQAKNLTLKICVNDAKKLLQDPSKACGFTTTKQQELDEEKIEI